MRLRVDGIDGAMLPADDPAITRGVSVFETMRSYGVTVFRLRQHLERFLASSEMVGLTAPAQSWLEEEVAVVVSADCYIRITLTGGGRLITQTLPIDQAKVGRIVRAAVVENIPSQWLPGSVKHSSRAGWVMSARGLGVEEVIFQDQQGVLLEANRSNVLVVRGGVILTPPTDGRILAGVTRSALFDAAKQAGLPMRAAEIRLCDGYDELYLTSTLKEVAPVELDGISGAGPVGKALHDALKLLVKAETSVNVGI
jgi:branched-chain amino acid aminotransferase